MRKKSRKLLSIVLTFLMASTSMMPAWAATGTDYDNHWAKPAIIIALDAGILKGYPDGTIKPDKLMTRAEFFSMVNNAFGYTEVANVSFNDVKESAWYASVIKKAFSAGYLNSIDGYIRPNDFITREEVAVYLSIVKSLGEAKTSSSLLDLNKATPNGKAAILSILEAKIMQGTPDNTFMPTAKTKRSEALTALVNAMAYTSSNTVYQKEGVYGSANEMTTITGNVIIKTGGVTLKNMIVTGDLTIAKEVGEGNVTLDTVTVKGNTYVNGGGVNSIYFIDVITGSVYVQKTDGPVRIVASGTSEIKSLIASSDIKLVETALTGTGFGSITVQKNAASGIDITLVGVKLDSLQIEAPGVTLISDAASTITKLVVDAANTKIQGQGVITTAEVNVSGTTFETAPVTTKLGEGITAPTIVAPTTPTTPTTPGTSTGGGSGGSDNDNDNDPVVTVTEISNADVAITSGSVIFGYTFVVSTDSAITYGQAKGAPYYLNESTSSVTLTDGTHTAMAYLSALGISDAGTVTYANVAAIQSAFTGLTFVPTEVDIHLVGATNVNSGANQWTKDVTVTLESGEIALLNPGYATAPTSVSLSAGNTSPATVATDVVLPLPGATDTHGSVTGWISGSADKVKFTVANGGAATSTITINGSSYTSGADYTLAGATTHTIVLTTIETGKLPAVRTFTFTVAAASALYATTPSAISLSIASTSPASIDVNVSIPLPGQTDSSGAVTYTTPSAINIAFEVTDSGSATSTITIDSVAYTSGDDYTISAPGALTVVVTTVESGKTTAIRTFIITVSP